jgi:hypothetical protein
MILSNPAVNYCSTPYELVAYNGPHYFSIYYARHHLFLEDGEQLFKYSNMCRACLIFLNKYNPRSSLASLLLKKF